MPTVQALKYAPAPSEWQLPGTAALWTLPVFIPCLALALEPSARVFRIAEAGIASVAVVLAIGLGAARRTRSAANSPSRQTTLRAFLATATVLGIAAIALTRDADLIYVALAPGLTWMLFAFLLPFWSDNAAVVDPEEPESGWKRVFGMRLVYWDPANSAVWVRMRTSFPFSRDIGYTPNFGHIWGRLALAMIFLPLGLGLTLSVMATR